MEEGIYKITDNFFLWIDEDKGDKLIYRRSISEKPDIQENDIQILKIKEIENNVNQAIQKYIRFLDIYNIKDIDNIKLFAFLLKVRLYREYILRYFFNYMLIDEYKQIIKDNTLTLAIAKYLSNKEPLSEKNKSIISNIDKFDKLYILFENATFGVPKSYIINLYNKFLDTLKAENISIQES